MPIGNPVTLTSNVASKTISATATASQTLFNVTGGYRINSLGVFKNGSRLQDGVDYIARDGLTVTLLSAASGGDKLQFVVFDTFRVAEAIRPAVDEQTIRGNLNVVGILSCTDLEGPVSLNITSGIQTFHDVRVGGALTVAGTLTYEDTTNSNVTGIATFSGGMNISGVGATATTLNVTGVSTFGDKVSIGDSIFHTGDINTSIRFTAADTFTVETGGSERVRVDSNGRVAVNDTGNAGYTSFSPCIALGDSGDSKPGLVIRGSTSSVGDISFCDNSGAEGDDGVSEGLIRYDHSTDHMEFHTADSERFRITAGGGFHFTNGELIERVKITAGKLSDNTNIDLENGNVHHFTTQETTTSTPNIRVNSSTSLNSVMAIGDTISVTLITTAAAGGYSAQLTIDGSAVTEKWNGGSAPSAGGSSGNDVITYQIIKTADATYTVLGNVSNFA